MAPNLLDLAAKPPPFTNYLAPLPLEETFAKVDKT